MNITISEEIWKDIKGFEGAYQISNKGNVKSLDREKEFKTNDGISIRKYKGMPLIANDNGSGYKYVSLGRGNRRYIHRIVAESFLSNPFEYEEVNHKDEDKGNNHIDNLEWCDREYNLSYGTRLERFKESSKGRIPWNKGLAHSKETKNKISEKAIQRMSDETNNPMYGKKHSQETRVKISKAVKEYYKKKII